MKTSFTLSRGVSREVLYAVALICSTSFLPAAFAAQRPSAVTNQGDSIAPSIAAAATREDSSQTDQTRTGNSSSATSAVTARQGGVTAAQDAAAAATATSGNGNAASTLSPADELAALKAKMQVARGMFFKLIAERHDKEAALNSEIASLKQQLDTAEKQNNNKARSGEGDASGNSAGKMAESDKALTEKLERSAAKNRALRFENQRLRAKLESERLQLKMQQDHSQAHSSEMRSKVASTASRPVVPLPARPNVSPGTSSADRSGQKAASVPAATSGEAADSGPNEFKLELPSPQSKAATSSTVATSRGAGGATPSPPVGPRTPAAASPSAAPKTQAFAAWWAKRYGLGRGQKDDGTLGYVPSWKSGAAPAP